MDRIWVTVSYHGELMGDNVYRKSLLDRWRNTADSFLELNVTVFDDYSPFLDQAVESNCFSRFLGCEIKLRIFGLGFVFFSVLRQNIGEL
ncbi:hypothetical protein GCK32_019058 [Trichostrongylus colubriformis]|uniref:Uncharacterized protein n=1 Tax=Trichostrongylus colubriformis TaxID=6319 RepID=A0AAN8J0Z1_TRICO